MVTVLDSGDLRVRFPNNQLWTLNSDAVVKVNGDETVISSSVNLKNSRIFMLHVVEILSAVFDYNFCCGGAVYICLFVCLFVCTFVCRWITFSREML